MNDELITLRDSLRKFSEVRDWDQFHSPKNLSMALIVEAAELVEYFQWLTEKQSLNLPIDKHQAIEEEIADIFIYLIRISDKFNIDLIEAANKKLEKNKLKYPADQVKGNSKKYTDY